MRTLSAFPRRPVERRKVAAQLLAARDLLWQDRRRGQARLNQIFRDGAPPLAPLDGRYVGAFVAFVVAPGLTQLAEALAATWRPWLGKTFDAVESGGDNILRRGSLAPLRLIWPGYHGYVDDGPTAFRGFPFRTYLAPGLADPDRRVLRLDYDLPANPRLIVRRVADDVVQIDQDLYLGKAHLRWRDGRWWTWAYFTLSR